jgi:hypothetical protein
MDNNIIILNNNRNYRPPSLILAALLASMLLSLPTAVSAHGREGRDREKMSSLLQSLFEMKARRATGAQPTPEWNPSSPIGESAGTWSDPSMGTWSDPSMSGPSMAPLSHESPPSQPPYHLGLLRVSGAAAAKLPAPILLRSSGGGGAGERRPTSPRLATLRGEVGGQGLDDAPDVKHDFVRDLRRQFELRQQRAQAEE